jgi:hypothetical protein
VADAKSDASCVLYVKYNAHVMASALEKVHFSINGCMSGICQATEHAARSKVAFPCSYFNEFL